MMLKVTELGNTIIMEADFRLELYNVIWILSLCVCGGGGGGMFPVFIYTLGQILTVHDACVLNYVSRQTLEY